MTMMFSFEKERSPDSENASARLHNENEPVSIQTDVLLSPDKALGCVSCGAVVPGSKFTSSTKCPYCGSELLPQREAYEQTVAGRGHFDGSLSATAAISSFPGLAMLENHGRKAFNALTDFSSYKGAKMLDKYFLNRVKAEQKPFLFRDLINWFYDRQQLFTALLQLPDDAMRVERLNDNYLEEADHILISLAHSNGSYSILDLAARSHHSRRSGLRNDVSYLKFSRWEDRNFQSGSEMLRDLDKISHGENPEGRIAQNSVYYSTDEWERLTLDDQKKEILLSMIPLLGNSHSSLSTHFKNMNKDELKELIMAQEKWFTTELIAKIENVKSSHGEKSFFREQAPLSEDDAKKIDYNYFLNNPTTPDGDFISVEAGVDLVCERCGKSLEGYNGSRASFQCGACNAYNDIVKTERISRSVLESRSIIDTLVPAGYTLQCLWESVNTQDANNLARIFFGPKSEWENHPYEITAFFHHVAVNNPHLLSVLDYKSRYSTVDGYALAVGIPDESEILFSTDQDVIQVPIDESLRGQTVVLRFADYFVPSYERTGYASWKLKLFSMPTEEYEAISSIQEWHSAVGGNYNGEDCEFEVGNEVNYNTGNKLERKSAEFFRPLDRLTYKIPQGLDISSVLGQ